MGRREQLARIESELADAHRRAHEMADAVDRERWTARPASDHWSVAECLSHLNLTSRAFLPLIRDAIARGRDGAPSTRRRFRMDFVGWLLWLVTTARVPIKTAEPFVPGRDEPRDMVLAELDALQDQLIGCLGGAEGLDLGKRRIVSPFDARIKYNLYSCLRLVAAHQRLHLRQAERVVHTLRTTRSGPER